MAAPASDARFRLALVERSPKIRLTRLPDAWWLWLADGMDELFGLPSHPLVVHAPVVLLPVAALGVLVMLLRHAWYLRYRWAVLALGAVGTVGAIIAAGTGEELEERVERGESRAALQAINEHAEAGELARTLAIVFLVALAAWVLIPWFLERRAEAATDADRPATRTTWLRPALMVVCAAAAIGSVVTVVDAGHSGASSVWNEEEGGSEDGD